LISGWREEIARLQERLADEPHRSAAGELSTEQPSDTRAREIERLRTLTTALDLAVDVALHDETLRRELSWCYQRAELDRALPRLSALITRPLRAALAAHGWGAPTQAIALIACERLSVAPFHAAMVANAQGVDAPLQETCELTFQASARTLARARATADALPSDGPVLSIGDPSPTRSAPLPHARFEAAGLAALAVQEGRSLSRALIGSAATLNATVAQLRQLGRSAPAQASLRGGWVDVASHGHADPTRLQSSFMVMADDEWLTLARLQSERLLEGARCFSASGCLTGLGDIIHAPDELGSFAAGAIQAGAAAVLATLWAVSDQANALLMLRVMELALTHPRESPAWALREAARWLRSASRQDVALLRARVRTAIREMASLNADAAGEAQPAPDAPPQDLARASSQLDRAAPVVTAIITSDPEMDEGSMNATVARVRGVTRAAERIAVEPASERMGASRAVRPPVLMGDDPQWDQPLARPTPDDAGVVPRALPPYAHPIFWAGVIAYGA
jgi:CHAT domain-containing protein